jgi:hypothetical protein
MNNSAKTRKQMAFNYGISSRTFNKWLRAENIELNPGLISPKLQMEILTKLGEPKNNNINNDSKK